MITFDFFLFIWFFYIQFAGAISIYRLWMQKKLNVWNQVAYSPYLAIFFALDVFFNCTVLLLLGIPPKGCITMSSRFQVYHTGLNLDGSSYTATEFQKAFGSFVCIDLLNPVDPSGNHC